LPLAAFAPAGLRATCPIPDGLAGAGLTGTDPGAADLSATGLTAGGLAEAALSPAEGVLGGEVLAAFPAGPAGPPRVFLPSPDAGTSSSCRNAGRAMAFPFAAGPFPCFAIRPYPAISPGIA
jgi:hypothetical protein